MTTGKDAYPYATKGEVLAAIRAHEEEDRFDRRGHRASRVADPSPDGKRWRIVTKYARGDQAR